MSEICTANSFWAWRNRNLKSAVKQAHFVKVCSQIPISPRWWSCEQTYPKFPRFAVDFRLRFLHAQWELAVQISLTNVIFSIIVFKNVFCTALQSGIPQGELFRPACTFWYRMFTNHPPEEASEGSWTGILDGFSVKTVYLRAQMELGDHKQLKIYVTSA